MKLRRRGSRKAELAEGATGAGTYSLLQMVLQCNNGKGVDGYVLGAVIGLCCICFDARVEGMFKSKLIGDDDLLSTSFLANPNWSMIMGA
ncbi:hypothetical protein ACSQ67_011613 [Phaseolus vulgaris]